MTATNTDTSIAQTVQDLRDCADWLEAHPLLTPRWGHLKLDADSRADLERLAACLGDRAIESVVYGDVQIEGTFGTMRVFAGVPLSRLAEEPAPPAYTPILPVRS